MAASPTQPPTPFRGWHDRGYLPHCDFANTTQTINFRLADSLPSHLREKWLEAEDNSERYRIKEQLLDQGYGACHLRTPAVARMVESALLHFHNDRYRLIAWVVMPNHVHTLVRIHDEFSVSQIMHSWRSFTGHEARKLIPGLENEFWAKDYFDRFTRDTPHFWNALRYIEKNPVKAKLCSNPDDWKFSSARFERNRETFQVELPDNLYSQN